MHIYTDISQFLLLQVSFHCESGSFEGHSIPLVVGMLQRLWLLLVAMSVCSLGVWERQFHWHRNRLSGLLSEVRLS